MEGRTSLAAKLGPGATASWMKRSAARVAVLTLLAAGSFECDLQQPVNAPTRIQDAHPSLTSSL